MKFGQCNTCFCIISVLLFLYTLLYKKALLSEYEVLFWFTNEVVKSFFWYHHGNDHSIRHSHLNLRRHMYSDENVLRLRKSIYLLNNHVFHLIHSARQLSVWFTSTLFISNVLGLLSTVRMSQYWEVNFPLRYFEIHDTSQKCMSLLTFKTLGLVRRS